MQLYIYFAIYLFTFVSQRNTPKKKWYDLVYVYIDIYKVEIKYLQTYIFPVSPNLLLVSKLLLNFHFLMFKNLSIIFTGVQDSITCA